LEVKGQDVPEAKAKHNALGEWVAAVNTHGGFGIWNCQVSFDPSDVEDKLAKFAVLDS
jgi:type III restriction enzyme